MNLRIVLTDRQGYLLKQRRLSGLWRGYDHSPLSLSDRRQEVNDPHGGRCPSTLQPQPFIREDRGHIFKIGSAHGLHRVHLIDPGQIEQGAELLLLRLNPGMAFQDVSRLKVELAYLGWGYIDVILSRQIVSASDESISVRKHFQDAMGDHSAVQPVNVMDLLISGIGRHLFYRLLGSLLFLLIFFQHALNKLCLLHRRYAFEPSCFCKIF